MIWNDFQDIKQLESITRAHIILAQMSGQSSPDYKDYLFKAYYSMMRLIYNSVDNALASLKDIQKQAAASVAAGGQESASGEKKKSDPKSKGTTPAVETKPAAKKFKTDGGASGYLPASIEQWSQFEFSEEITSAWAHDLMKKTGINANTIVEPYLLFYYLDLMAQMLDQLGYSNLLFPVYNLQLLLVNNLIKFDSSSVKNLMVFFVVKII
jgi:hypothetical protein